MTNPYIHLSDDGVVNVLDIVMPSLTFAHLHSQFDNDIQDKSSHFTGITEWVSIGEPSISVGWDWRAFDHFNELKFERISDYRTNIRVFDKENREIELSTVTSMLVVIFRRGIWEYEVENTLKFVK